jgi:hypothetical protein
LDGREALLGAVITLFGLVTLDCQEPIFSPEFESLERGSPQVIQIRNTNSSESSVSSNNSLARVVLILVFQVQLGLTVG